MGSTQRGTQPYKTFVLDTSTFLVLLAKRKLEGEHGQGFALSVLLAFFMSKRFLRIGEQTPSTVPNIKRTSRDVSRTIHSTFCMSKRTGKRQAKHIPTIYLMAPDQLSLILPGAQNCKANELRTPWAKPTTWHQCMNSMLPGMFYAPELYFFGTS